MFDIIAWKMTEGIIEIVTVQPIFFPVTNRLIL